MDHWRKECHSFRKQSPQPCRGSGFHVPLGALRAIPGNMRTAVEHFFPIFTWGTWRMLQKNKSLEFPWNTCRQIIVRIFLNFKKFAKPVIFTMFPRVSNSRGWYSPSVTTHRVPSGDSFATWSSELTFHSGQQVSAISVRTRSSSAKVGRPLGFWKREAEVISSAEDSLRHQLWRLTAGTCIQAGSPHMAEKDILADTQGMTGS